MRSTFEGQMPKVKMYSNLNADNTISVFMDWFSAIVNFNLLILVSNLPTCGKKASFHHTLIYLDQNIAAKTWIWISPTGEPNTGLFGKKYLAHFCGNNKKRRNNPWQFSGIIWSVHQLCEKSPNSPLSISSTASYCLCSNVGQNFVA